MAYARPEFSNGEVRRAGDVLRLEAAPVADLEWANHVLANWRASHAYPLNTFQSTLRRKLRGIDREGVVAERLKRAPSVVAKLKRFPTMTLVQMQDIAGLRAIVSNVYRLYKLESSYVESTFEHELVNFKDYVQRPKQDGYRSIHYVYRYYNPSVPMYDRLHVELQMRTKLQHAWATAVETVDTFMGQKIKAGEPTEEWAAFFQLVSTAFARIESQPSPEPCAELSNEEVVSKLRAFDAKRRVLAKLSGFRVAANKIHSEGRKDTVLHLVVLNLESRFLNIRSYSRQDQKEANSDYAAIEKRVALGEPLDAVLVAGSTLKNLKKTYPNYYLDTQAFVARVGRVLQHGLDLAS